MGTYQLIKGDEKSEAVRLTVSDGGADILIVQDNPGDDQYPHTIIVSLNQAEQMVAALVRCLRQPI